MDSEIEKILKKIRDEPRPRPPPEILPDLTPNVHLVAFIDILGFGHEIENAKTRKNLESVYRKVRIVQKEFQKQSAADDPAQMENIHRIYGKRVLALSDAVVVAITPDSRGASLLTPYDFLGFALYELSLAQMRCVVNHGIFLRGGISHGSFFFENDVLISPALSRAYQLENKHAEYPVIAMSEETRRAILAVPQQGSYGSGTARMESYFARHGRRVWRGKPLYFLDYLGATWHDADPRMTSSERERARAAKEAHNSKLAQRLFDRSYQRGEGDMLLAHRKAIESAYRNASTNRVKRKYRWLMRYHNRCFPHHAPFLRKGVIDLSRFSR